MANTNTTIPSKRVRRASIRIVDPENDGAFALASHRDARAAAEAVAVAEAARAAAAASSRPPSPSRTSTRGGSVTCEDADDDEASLSTASNAGAPARKKRKPSKKKDTTRIVTTPVPEDQPPNGTPQPEEVSPSSVVDVPDDDPDSESSEDEPTPVKKRNPTEDIDGFFLRAVKRGPKGAEKAFRKCKLCPKEKFICNETSTLRRHIQANHKKRYLSWCKRHNAESKLPADVKARKAAAAADLAQTTLDGHVEPIPATTPLLKYTDARFREVAQEWIIATNQPIQCVDHPKFHEMIDMASRATDGVKIPTRQATRDDIINRFKVNVAELADRLNSDAVRGEISLTCDAWQAANRDAYFAVTGHWVEEVSPTDWRLRSALLGFTPMNTKHNGAALGRALYNIAKRYRIQHKIGHITCDNASNNMTMLKAFEVKLNKSRRRRDAGVKPWKHGSRHIRCLAHIINLATQAFIGTYSKTPHINTDSTATDVDSALDDLSDVSLHVERDEVGLIRLIAVKARSSAKRSALIKDLQSKNDVKIPLALILDMKVRWSSTFAMLKRAYDLREYIADFIFKIAREEPSAEKARALRELCVTEEEWGRVREVLKILKHADEAQHAFSSDTEPALLHALPALERLHKTWSSIALKPKYSRYHLALNAALEKINTYYNKTSSVNAYNMSMILDPGLKTQYFQKNWGQELETAARDVAEELFEQRWLELNPPAPTATSRTRPAPPTASRSRLDINDSSDDEMEDAAPTQPTPTSAEKPWRKEFKRYLDGNDELDDGQSIVSWWGVNARRLPTWASLARDYLAVMASSVSSERAFSAAGITISKRRSSLQADIVEALQILKSLINSALIFREPDATADWEFENEVVDEDGDPAWEDEGGDSEDEVVE